MHCVTIKKLSFYALTWMRRARPGTDHNTKRNQVSKYGRVKPLQQIIQIQCYSVTNRHNSIIFTIRLIALNKNIEL